MSEMITIARPYARALFEYALEDKALAKWSETLRVLAIAVADSGAVAFLENPATSDEEHCSLLLNLFEPAAQPKTLKNLLNTLASNNRLMLLPAINRLFDEMRAEQEKTLTAQVVSYLPLTDEQQHHLIDSLSNKLNRKVTLEMTIDNSLMGGAIIFAGDLVINGSIRDKLNKLAGVLAA